MLFLKFSQQISLSSYQLPPNLYPLTQKLEEQSSSPKTQLTKRPDKATRVLRKQLHSQGDPDGRALSCPRQPALTVTAVRGTMQSESSRDVPGLRICQPEHGKPGLDDSCCLKGLCPAALWGPRHRGGRLQEHSRQVGPRVDTVKGGAKPSQQGYPEWDALC